jgi:hypothetical protein
LIECQLTINEETVSVAEYGRSGFTKLKEPNQYAPAFLPGSRFVVAGLISTCLLTLGKGCLSAGTNHNIHRYIVLLQHLDHANVCKAALPPLPSAGATSGRSDAAATNGNASGGVTSLYFIGALAQADRNSSGSSNPECLKFLSMCFHRIKTREI